jgi:hypothetical protein
LHGVVVVASLHPDGDFWAYSELVKEFEEAGVSFVEACDDVVGVLGGFGEGDEAPAFDLRGGLGEDLVAVRAVALFAEFFDEFGFEGGRDGVFEPLGFGVDLMPLHAEHLGEHAFDEMMTEGGAVGGLSTFGGEFEGAFAASFDVAVFAEAFYGFGDGGCGDLQPLGQQSGDDGVAFALGFNDCLEVVFFRDCDFLRHDCKLTMVKAFCHRRSAWVAGLFRLFLVFEKLSCFFEVEEVAVYDEFVDACVIRD